MNYYSHHIGDYRGATAHLTNEEDLAYRRLLEMYYDTERPIPADTQWVSRRLRIGSNPLATVLQDFFVLEDDGYHNPRCDEELAKYARKAETAKANGKNGGRRKSLKPLPKNPVGTYPQPTANPDLTQPLANQEPRTTNQEPRTTNQEPRTTNQEPRTTNQADISADAERDNPELFPAESLSQNPPTSEDSPQPQNLRSAQKKNIPAKLRPDYAAQFDQFWAVYPKKRAGSKEAAKAAYQKAVKRGFAEQEIISGAEAYAVSGEVSRGYAKGAAAWLNDDRFTHDYSEAPNGRKNYPNRASKQDRIEDALAAAKLEIAERWTESARADAPCGTFDGRLHGDECFRQDAGIIEGDYTVVSG